MLERQKINVEIGVQIRKRFILKEMDRHFIISNLEDLLPDFHFGFLYSQQTKKTRIEMGFKISKYLFVFPFLLIAERYLYVARDTGDRKTSLSVKLCATICDN